jgi:hypothetical protein
MRYTFLLYSNPADFANMTAEDWAREKELRRLHWRSARSWHFCGYRLVATRRHGNNSDD